MSCNVLTVSMHRTCVAAITELGPVNFMQFCQRELHGTGIFFISATLIQAKFRGFWQRKQYLARRAAGWFISFFITH